MDNEQPKAVVGTVSGLRTMADGSLRVQVDLETPDEEAYRMAVTSIARKDAALALARLTDEAAVQARAKAVNREAEAHQSSGAAEPAETEKPYGQVAQQLYKAGFLQAPPVLQVLGSEAEYEEWLRGQLCLVCGDGDWNLQTGEIRNEPAHIRRVAAGSGTGTRPPYHAVPACHEHHQLQHDKGYLAAARVAAKHGRYRSDLDEDVAMDWFDRQAVARKQEWAKRKLHTLFGVDSLGRIEPASLAAWADTAGVAYLLPEAYRYEHVPG